MKKVLKFFLGLIVFSCALFCAVILISLEQCSIALKQCSIALKKNAEKDKAPKEVITRVEEYVRNKYDVKAKLVDSEANYKWVGFDFIIPHKEYDGSYSLDMKVGGKSFNVLVGSDGIISDNYQFPEIEDSLKAFFSDVLPSDDIMLSMDTAMLTDPIDCSDMNTFLNEHHSIIELYLVDSELNSDSFDDIKSYARSCGSTICLLSCRSANGRDSLINGKRTMSRGDAASKSTSLYSDYAMYVKEVWECQYNSTDNTHAEEYNELKIDNYGDLYYTVPENSTVRVKDSDKKTYIDDYTGEDHHLITPSFNLTCTECITVFYPVEKAESVELASNEVYKCGGKQVDIIGDYFIYRIYTKEWYKENKYYKDGDKKIFGVYVDKYY